MSRALRVLITVVLFGSCFGLAISANAQEPTTVHIMVGLGINVKDRHIAALDMLANDFNAAHDDIQIAFDIVQRDTALSDLEHQIDSGTAPDIVGPINNRNLQYLNYLWTDLAPLIEADNYDLNAFYYRGVEILRHEDRQLGLPLGFYPSMIMYNADLFDDAQLDYPSHQFEAEGWTFDALRQMALELTRDSNGFTALEPEFDQEDIVQWGFDDSWASMRELVGLWGDEQAGVSSDGHTMLLNSPTWINAITWYRDGINEHFIPREEELDDIYASGASDPFSSGQVAMFYTHTWHVFPEGEYLDFNWDVAAVPTTPDGKTSARLQAEVFAITEASQHKNEAWQVLMWLLAPEQQARLCVASGVFTCVPSAVSLQDETRDVILEMYPTMDTQVIFDSIGYGDLPSHESWMPNQPAVEDLLANAAPQLFAGELADADIGEFLGTLNEQAQTIADEYWAKTED